MKGGRSEVGGAWFRWLESDPSCVPKVQEVSLLEHGFPDAGHSASLRGRVRLLAVPGLKTARSGRSDRAVVFSGIAEAARRRDRRLPPSTVRRIH